jgi:hypothetical protein
MIRYPSTGAILPCGPGTRPTYRPVSRRRACGREIAAFDTAARMLSLDATAVLCDERCSVPDSPTRRACLRPDTTHPIRLHAPQSAAAARRLMAVAPDSRAGRFREQLRNQLIRK